MAGIGFELKKLFNRRGLFAAFRAYGYAGVVCTGPMLLGVVLLLGVMFLCDITGSSRHSRELAGMYDHIYSAGIPDRHKFSFYGGHQIYCRSAV